MEFDKRIVDLLDESNIFISGEITERDDGEYEVELEWQSNLGEDVIEHVYYDGTPEGFVKGFWKMWDDFDPDEHAEMWIKNRKTVRGVPQSIRDLINDADDIKEFMESVAEKLQYLVFEEV